MKILLGNHTLNRRGGTEAWTRIMYRTLSRDHQVSVFAAEGECTFPELKSADMDDSFDLALVNHHTAVRALRHTRVGVVIQTSHGVIPALEWPVCGASAHVSVSEEVQEFIPFPSVVIQNPIDAIEFRPTAEPSAALRRIAFLSNNASPAARLLSEASAILNCELRTVGEVHGGQTDTPSELMDWADVVVGLGRTALEGLAMKRNVFLLDRFGSAGMVTADNFFELGKRNWSGRGVGTWPTPSQLAHELVSAYDPDRDLRRLIEVHHDPAVIASKYLDLSQRIGPVSRRLSALVRRTPGPWMKPRFTTFIDPLLREMQGRYATDGRPQSLRPFLG